MRNPPLCSLCAAPLMHEGIVVHDAVRDAAALPRDAPACIACLERRLHRRLTVDDFTDAPANSWPALTIEQRAHHPLVSRLPLLDRHIPAHWSARWLDRLGLSARYRRFVDADAE